MNKKCRRKHESLENFYLLIIIFVSLIPQISAASPAGISIYPESQMVEEGKEFTINISIDPADNPITAAQSSLLFNSPFIEVKSITEGNLFKQNGANTLFNPGILNNNEGTLLNVWGIIITPGASVATKGIFATITMKAKTTGVSMLNLTNVIISDTQGSAVQVNVTDGLASIYETRPVDVTPPTITILSPQNIQYFTNVIPLTYYANEPVTECYVSVDGTANQTTCANMSVMSREYRPTSNMAAWWHFNENSGNVVQDSSENNNTGNRNGASRATGKFGSALQFDGSSYMEVPDSNILDGGNQITIEAWVRPIIGTRGSIVAKYTYNYTIPVNGRVYELDIANDGKVSFALSSNGTGPGTVWLTSSNVVINNTWNHIVATSNGTTMKLYINGDMDTNMISAPPVIHSSPYNLQIGAWKYDPGGTTGTYFKGIIDEVRILKKALKEEEIKADYALGAGSHNITIFAKDISGISNSSMRYFSIDTAPPSVTGPTANHEIPDDTDSEPLWGEVAQLNVTVTDDNGVAGVTVDLSEIGGPAAKPMTSAGDNIYSTTANASADTPPKLYNLTVNAIDIFGNSNTIGRIQLRVMKNGDTTGDSMVNIGDAMRLANNVSYYGDPRYALSSIYVADVTGDGIITIGDAIRLANNVSYPGNTAYILR